MKFIFGLGNPGKDYEASRHNAGFMVVDELAKKLNGSFSLQKKLRAEVLKLDQVILAKPQTFMNKSGEAVRAVVEYYSDGKSLNNSETLEQVFVIHDDLDLDLGAYKLQQGVGPKAHNGLESVYKHLGRKDFWHVRIGIDTRAGDRTIPSDQYVLQKFTSGELKKLQAVIEEVAGKLLN